MKHLLIGFCVLLSLGVVASDPSCGGNCRWNDCQSCPCGSTPNFVNVTALCESVSTWDAACCKCIVMNGSKGNANNVITDEDNFDIGLFHLNSLTFQKSCSGLKNACNPSDNLNCAVKLYNSDPAHPWFLWSNLVQGCEQCIQQTQFLQ